MKKFVLLLAMFTGSLTAMVRAGVDVGPNVGYYDDGYYGYYYDGYWYGPGIYYGTYYNDAPAYYAWRNRYYYGGPPYWRYNHGGGRHHGGGHRGGGRHH